MGPVLPSWTGMVLSCLGRSSLASARRMRPEVARRSDEKRLGQDRLEAQGEVASLAGIHRGSSLDPPLTSDADVSDPPIMAQHLASKRVSKCGRFSKCCDRHP